MRVDFYHLQRSPLETALPQLVAKIISGGHRAVILAGSEARVESINNLLWVFDTDSWLPHGSKKDGNADKHPVWISDIDENPNNANILVLTDGMTSENIDSYERCLNVFDGKDEEAVARSRKMWKTFKDSGKELHYWQQNDRGGWTEKG